MFSAKQFLTEECRFRKETVTVHSPEMEDHSKTEDNTLLALLQMSGQQRGLYEALDEIHQNLADMYLGALTAFSSNNPDRLAQAAHSLRELIEKLPMYIGIPFRSANLGEKVQNSRATMGQDNKA